MEKPTEVSEAARPRRGRRPRNKAVLDFSVADAMQEYEAKRADLSGRRNNKRLSTRSRADLAAHEQAAEAMQETRKQFGNISCKRLFNLMSEFRHCKVSQADEIPPDDHDPQDHIVPEKPYRLIPLSEQRTPKN